MNLILRLIFSLILFFVLGTHGNAQVSGTVFRDFNNSGTRQTAVGYIEPMVPGIIVNAYNNADVLIASYKTNNGVGSYPYAAPNYSIPVSGTAYNGIQGSNTGFVGNGTKIRLEFIIPSSGSLLADDKYDYSSKGSGTSVRFVSGGVTNIDYGINNPADYVSTVNPRIYVPQYTNGDPLGGGTSGSYSWFSSFDYNSSGTTATIQNADGTTLGSVYGVAFSRQAQKIFTSAFLKRHSGLGVLGSGGIYKIDPATFSVAAFYDMDANGYRTRAATGAVAFGEGSSFSISQSPDVLDWGGTATHSQTINYLGAIDPVSGAPCGLGVIGNNDVDRALPKNRNSHNNDPAAFDQVGKVSLGDLEISDDGKFLFVVNLYDRKIYRLELNNAYNPTSIISITGYSLPAVPVTNGVLRPFGLKYYRGKLYAGAVSTGENSGTVSNLFAYVFELNNPAAAASFTFTPILQFPLNYNKGVNSDGVNESWKVWDNVLPTQTYNWDTNDPQPIFSGIEFDVDGSMIIGLRDRAGDQLGVNRELTGSKDRMVITAGEIHRAYYNSATLSFEIENNGKEGTSSPKPATLGMGNNQGMNGGEFYYQDNISSNSVNTSMGSLVLLPGMGEVTTTIMDPMVIYTGGISWMNNSNGSNPRDYQMYSGSGIGSNGKANGLGDIEFAGIEPPIEFGNRIWNDANANGIQNANEVGIAGVNLEIFVDNNYDGVPDGAAIGTTTTNADGDWYFNDSNITGDGDPVTAGTQPVISSGINYVIRPAASSWSNGAGIGIMSSLRLTKTNITGNGAIDLSDNDAVNHGTGTSLVPQIEIVAGNAGQNNHNLDFGFVNFSVLPSEGLLLSTTLNSSQVTLNWKTISETNTDRFEIERSTDGIFFAKISADVSAAGSNPFEKQYNQKDDISGVQHNGTLYYRVKLYDKLGGFKYSNVASVKLTSTGIKVWPNPFAEMLQVSITAQSAGKVDLRISDAAGRIVITQQQKVSAGVNQLILPGLSRLTKGTYIVELINLTDGSRVTHKLTKE